jgi:hypothetical protein
MQNGTRRRKALSRLGDSQFGVVSRRQLVVLGFSAATISRLAVEGYLRPVLHGVFALGHRTMTRDAWLMACTLAGGPDAVLAARAGSSVYGLLPATSVTDLIVCNRQALHLPGIRAHRCTLEPCDRVVHHGLPVTSLERTLLDLAGTEPAPKLAEALDRALLLRLYDHPAMLAVFGRYPRRRGVRALRAALERLGDEPDRFRSGTERKARDLIVAAGLHEPDVNAWFPTVAGHGHELDLYFRDLALDVEIDGPQHDMPWQQRKARWRDADLRARGIRVERFPVRVVDDTPERFVVSVGRLIAECA